jgi:hypothetical protein
MGDKDYLCKEGLKHTILDDRSRKDVVAGGLGDFLWKGIIVFKSAGCPRGGQ